MIKPKEAKSLAQAHIEAAQESLANPKVRRALGEKAEQLSYIVDNLHIARLKKDLYVPTGKMDENAIPLIVADPEDWIYIDIQKLQPPHPYALELLRQTLENDGWGRLTDDELAEIAEVGLESYMERVGEEWKVMDITGNMGMNFSGRSWVLPFAGHEEQPKRVPVATRPVIMIDMNTETFDGEVLLHESMHAWQILNNPINRDNSKKARASRELEAREVEAVVGRALRRKRHEGYYREAYRVEKLRQSTRRDGDGPYDITPTMARGMRYHGYMHTFAVKDSWSGY